MVRLPAGSFRVDTRRVGFEMAQAAVKLTADDTVRIHIIIKPTAQTMAAVQIDAKRDPGVSMTAEMIAKSPFPTVDMFLSRHPRMLGDAYKQCDPDHYRVPLRVFIN